MPRPTVMFYIFLIAVLNLGLGFAAAMQLGRRYNSLAIVSPSFDSETPEAPSDNYTKNDTPEPSMDLGMKEDGDTLEKTPAEDSSKQPRDTIPNELEEDLDKLFDNIDL